MCEMQLTYIEITKYLMQMLGLNKTIDQLAMANSVFIWSCIKEERWSCLVSCLEKVSQFEDESQWKTGHLKRTWKWQVEEESMKVGLCLEDALCPLMWTIGVN